MKILKSSPIFLLILLILNSCVVEKRIHLTGYHVHWKNQQYSTAIQSNNDISSIDENDLELSSTFEKSKSRIELVNDSSLLKVTSLELCDTIILKNQDTIIANITKQDAFKIKYKRCERKSGEYFNISKSEIHKVNYSDGRVDQFNEKIEQVDKTEKLFKKTTIQPEKDAKMHPFSLVSGISSLIGIVGIILSLVSITIGIIFLPLFFVGSIFGYFALKRINKEPTKWKGKDFATFGFYVGTAFVLLTLLVLFLSAMLNNGL
jgi:hypothetical protein